MHPKFHFPRPSRRRLPQRRGVILITVLGIVVILAGMVLAYSVSMRSEGLASANRLSYAQADAVEQAAEMWVLAQIESYPSDALSVTEVPAEGVQVGTGYFWILHPDPTQYQTLAYGITDEAGKININSASADQLSNLPYIQDETDVADNIVAWAANASQPPDTAGATSQYYESLQEPYETRVDYGLNPGFESMEELLLVENVTPQMLYGSDLNRNGVLDTAEQTSNGNTMIQSGSDDPRGFFNFATCYSKVPGANPNATSTVNINTRNLNALQTALTNLSIGNASQIVNGLMAQMPRAGNPRWDMGGFYTAITQSGLTPAQFGQLFDSLTTNPVSKIIPLNVNTASAQAMGCLPGLTYADGQNLADAQTNGTSAGDLSWFFNALQPNQIAAVIDYITDRSYQYSADIVAVSGDGRSFKRVRIVVDASGLVATTPMPAQIVYRKDLTSLGWPLSAATRNAMRQGQSPPDANSNTNNPGTGIQQQ